MQLNIKKMTYKIGLPPNKHLFYVINSTPFSCYFRLGWGLAVNAPPCWVTWANVWAICPHLCLKTLDWRICILLIGHRHLRELVQSFVRALRAILWRRLIVVGWWWIVVVRWWSPWLTILVPSRNVVVVTRISPLIGITRILALVGATGLLIWVLLVSHKVHIFFAWWGTTPSGMVAETQLTSVYLWSTSIFMDLL